MIVFSRRALLAGLALSPGAGLTLAQAAPGPQRVPIELVQDTLALDGAAYLGNPRGDVIMVEYFDYNCPWCKRSAAEIEPLLKAEPEITYVLVNYAVLGAPSVEATRAALAFMVTMGRDRYLQMHKALFSLRGPVTGERAVAAAERLGADRETLVRTADDPRITQWMKDAFNLGNSLGLVATPSYLVASDAFVGYLNLDRKRQAIARARA